MQPTAHGWEGGGIAETPAASARTGSNSEDCKTANLLLKFTSNDLSGLVRLGAHAIKPEE